MMGMYWKLANLLLPHAIVSLVILQVSLVASNQPFANSLENGRGSDFIFRLLPAPEENESREPTTASLNHTVPSDYTGSTDSEILENYTSYESWTAETTDLGAIETATVSALESLSNTSIVDPKNVVSQYLPPSAAIPNDNDADKQKLETNMAPAADDVTSDPPVTKRIDIPRSGFIFTLIRTTLSTPKMTPMSPATSITPTLSFTKLSTTRRNSPKMTFISKNPTVGTPSSRVSTVNSRTIRTEQSVSSEGEVQSSNSVSGGNERENKIVNRLSDNNIATERTSDIIAPRNEFTTGAIEADMPGVILGSSPFWDNWYWVVIAVVLFIIVFLIPGCFCQVCLAKRFKAKQRRVTKTESEQNDEEESPGTCQSSSSSHSNSNSSTVLNISPSKSAKSSDDESDKQNSEHRDTVDGKTSKENPIVITIPDPMQQHSSSKRDEENKLEAEASNERRKTSKNNTSNGSPSEPRDVRLEIGNEAIIQSTDVKTDRIPKAADKPCGHTNAAKPHRRTKPDRKQHKETKRTIVPHSRHKRATDDLSKKQRTRSPGKVGGRSDTKMKLSESTKSILETARDLDDILAAITNLTHEYPIPECSETRKRHRRTKSPRVSKPRKYPTENSTQADHNQRMNKDQRQARVTKRGHDGKNKMKSSRRSKKQRRDKEKSTGKPTDEKANSSKKVPTLVKEELPAVNTIKNEQRRRRLERDLKKLQNYHNKQCSAA